MNYFVKMDVNAIRDGLIGKVGGVKHFAVLAAIASFANAKGEAFPSQDTISELVGYSRKTVVQVIKELRKVKVDGEPIMNVVQETTARGGRRNKYVLSPKSGFTFGSSNVTQGLLPNVTDSDVPNVTHGLQEEEPIIKENQIKENNIIFDNAKAVLDYFRQQYFERYDVAYQPNWGRDQAMIKNKLLSNFTDVQIKAIVDVAIKEYESRWAKPKFPRPTIGQLCTWLANEALAIHMNQQKEAERIKRESSKYTTSDEYLDRLLDEI